METNLNNILDQALSSFSVLDVKTLTEKVKSSSSRPSLMHITIPSCKPMVHKLASFGPQASSLIEAGCSEEGSDEETCFPSIRLVSNTILDSRHTAITDQPTHHRFHPPAIIISNLDKRIPLSTLKSVLDKIGSGVLKVNAASFYSENFFIMCGIVFFHTLEEASNMYGKLARYEKRGILASKLMRIPGSQTVMNARWLNYRVFDPNFDWTAVVLRGIKAETNAKEIEEWFGGVETHVEQPREVNFELCTIVVVKGVVEAYKALKIFRARKLKGKADLHPDSSVFKCPEQSVEVLFRDYWRKRKTSIPLVALKSFNNSEDESDDARSLISSVSGTIEDGEIADTDAPNSETQSKYYILYEFPGCFITKDQEKIEHSGVYIKTAFTNNLN